MSLNPPANPHLQQTVERPPLISLALLSASSLAFEVLLLQIFSVVEWHHFAYMIISVALLGFGAGGTFVFLTQRVQLAHYRNCVIAYCLVFALLAPLTFVMTKRIPYNSLAFLWDAQQWLYVFELYLLLALPFFLVGSCICLSIRRYETRAGLIYSADMLGAGGGAITVVLAMFWLQPDVLLRLIGCLAWLAAVFAWLGLSTKLRWLDRSLSALAITLALLVTLPVSWLQLEMSSYKGLRQMLEMPGTEQILERWSPLGVTSVVASSEVPLRHAPGMSLSSRATIPEQLAIFVNGDGPEALTMLQGSPRELDYLDQLTSALPFHLQAPGAALVIGASGTDPVLQARNKAWTVDVVEMNPSLITLLTHDFADSWDYPAHRDSVRFHNAEVRSWLQRERKQFDLIELPLAGSPASAGPGLHGLMENYLLTVEGFGVLLHNLKPGGMVSVSDWQRLPPRPELRLIDTAGLALLARGIQDPSRHIVMIRGWQTTTIIVSLKPLDAAAMQKVRAFCTSRLFDLAAGPGISPQDSNHYNLLGEDLFHMGASALLGDARATFLKQYKFDVRATHDNRPYFSNFFRWDSLGEIWALRTVGGAALLEWSYPMLVLTFLQALLAGIILIILPIALVRRSGKGMPAVAGYFASIGFAFMFIEIGFIQRFVLLLGHPLYAVPVVVATFLLFAGLGSRMSERISLAHARLPFLLLTGISVLYLVIWPRTYAWLAGVAEPVQVIASVLLLAPLAFTMGMPLPLGVRRIAQTNDSWIPWGWAINGSASVAGAVLATIIAVHAGFFALIGIALALYLVAAAIRL